MKIVHFAFWSLLAAVSSLYAAEEKKEQTVEIQLVSYEGDFGEKADRLFVIHSTAYRNFAALKRSIPGFSREVPLHFVVYGRCDTSSPSFSAKEIKELSEECAKSGVQFTYFPGG